MVQLISYFEEDCCKLRNFEIMEGMIEHIFGKTTKALVHCHEKFVREILHSMTFIKLIASP